MRYFIRTYGCQLNFADSERFATLFEVEGLKPAKFFAEADLIVINTCSVRQAAEDKVYGLAPQVLKAKGPPSLKLRRAGARQKAKVILTGCVVGSAKGERKRIKLSDLKRRLPWIDEFLTHDELVKKFTSQKQSVQSLQTNFKLRRKDPALVPVMRGCNQFCTYCVVPFGRGPIQSRPMEEIIDEVECLVAHGVKWVMLLGQSVNDYGKDFVLKSPRVRPSSPIEDWGGRGQKGRTLYRKHPFAQLLRRVHVVDGLQKISFLSPNPWNFPDELIEALALPKMERFVHLPVQSGDDGILKKMNRPYTIAEYKNLVKKIRKRIPGIKIGTDVIVGFPGETEKQFQNTVKLFKEVKFDVAYIAMYSERPGTAAAKLYKDDVPLEEKRRRHKILMETFKKNRLRQTQ